MTFRTATVHNLTLFDDAFVSAVVEAPDQLIGSPRMMGSAAHGQFSLSFVEPGGVFVWERVEPAEATALFVVEHGTIAVKKVSCSAMTEFLPLPPRQDGARGAVRSQDLRRQHLEVEAS